MVRLLRVPKRSLFNVFSQSLNKGKASQNKNSKLDDALLEAVMISDRETRYQMVEALIAQNANVNARNRNGDSPLDLARMRQDEQLKQLLKYHGADDTHGLF